MKLKKVVRQQLEKLFDIKYRVKRKHYVWDYNSWVKELEQTGAKENQSAATTQQEPPEAVLLSFSGGCWRKDAQAYMNRFFAENPEVLLAYGDEDMIVKKNVFSNPWLKPCWSPDAYLCRDYLGNAVAVRRSLFEQLTEEECQDEGLCHDKLVALAGGFTKGCRAIAHVNGIFFHRQEQWALPGEGRSGSRIKLQETKKEMPEKKAADTLVSVIIPSKDNVSVLKQCLEALCRTVKETAYEIIVVDNGSSAQNKGAVSEEIDRLNRDAAYKAHLQRAVYLYKSMEFNFSRMCNLGAKEAKGNLLLFLNDDVTAVEEGWLDTMAQKALQPWTGAVGYKLLYPDAERIQHAGVTNLSMGPAHRLQRLTDRECHYDGRNRGVWNMLAVTGACLMLRRKVFEEVGGFCEKLKVAFNDVDLCFTLYEQGYQNLVINSGFLLHHESLSRGLDNEDEEKAKRLLGERGMLYERHPNLEGWDPYYHIWLNGSVLDPEIKLVEVIPIDDIRAFEDAREYDLTVNLAKAREDKCLFIGIEIANKKQVTGYAMVLGSDNAFFKKQLLLQKEGEPKIVYGMDFAEQYRADLEKNTDQVNVGLCGFYLLFKEPLPAGEYRLGMLARDQISGKELINWSNRTIVSGRRRKKH